MSNPTLTAVEAQIRDICVLTQRDIFRSDLVDKIDEAKGELDVCRKLLIEHHADHHLIHPEHEHLRF